MSSLESDGLGPEHRKVLLEIAQNSIAHGLEHGRALPVDAADHPPELRALRIAFVTLRIQGNLRGCMGSSQPVRPLVEDVARNAYAAAFLDPRFSSLTREELADLDLHISILSPFEEMRFASEEELLAQVRPEVDGLLLEEREHRGILLPSVWEVLTSPGTFLRHLKLKAGLPETYWSDTLKVFRYTAESIP